MQEENLQRSGDATDSVVVQTAQVVLGGVPVSRKGAGNEVHYRNVPHHKGQVVVADETENEGRVCLEEGLSEGLLFTRPRIVHLIKVELGLARGRGEKVFLCNFED